MTARAVCLSALLMTISVAIHAGDNTPSPYLFIIEDTGSGSKERELETATPSKGDDVSEIIESQIKERRNLCGWGDLEPDDDVLSASTSHADYIQYFNKHSKQELATSQLSNESYLKNSRDISYSKNPYFTGETYGQRLDKARYYSYAETGVESIISIKDETDEDLEAKATAALDVAFSTPITMRAILDQNSQHIGASFRAYNTRSGSNKNLLVVSLGDGAQPRKSSDDGASILTYPCDSSGLVPFKPVSNLSAQTAASLAYTSTSSLQPVYIKSGKSDYIDVFDILLVDEDRNIEIPTQVYTSDSKPSNIFNAKSIESLHDNEAFIVPAVGNTYIEMCDDFDECVREKDSLQPNTTYKVSFTVNDRDGTKRHSLNFKTLPIEKNPSH